MSVAFKQTPNEKDRLKSRNSQFVIGRDERGRWIITEKLGRAGGIFVSLEAALKYAASEWGQRPETLRWSNEPLALWNFGDDAASSPVCERPVS